MDTKDFFTKLEKFCKGKAADPISTKCHECELLGFCYSPPSGFNENCDIDKVIQFVAGLQD